MQVSPYDEPAIEPDDLLIRRVNPVQHVVYDSNRNCERLSSKAMSPSSGPDDGMSVDVEKLIIENGWNPAQFVTTPVFTGSVAFQASTARALGLRIGFEPLMNNICHGEVWGAKDRPNYFTKGQQTALLKGSHWYVSIPDVEIC